MSLINYSENESIYYGVKVGRTERLQTTSLDNLNAQIYDDQYDVVKVKLDMNDKDLFKKLKNLPYFIEIYSIITLQKRLLNASEDFNASEQITFELYDGSQKEILRDILEQIHINDNIFYSTNLLDSVKVQSNKRVELLDYYLSINHIKNPNEFMFIGNCNEKAIGLCSFKKTKHNEAEGIFYGIIPEYRNKRLAQDFLNFSLNTLTKEGVEIFNTEVLFQNFKSIFPHINTGFKPVDLFLNAILYPMASKNNLVFQTTLTDIWININKFLIDHFELDIFSIEKSRIEIKGPIHLANVSILTDVHFLGFSNNHYFFKATNEEKTLFFQIII